MLKQVYGDKNIALIGYHALSAKTLIKKLISVVNQPIIVITVGNYNQNKIDQFLSNNYFNR